MKLNATGWVACAAVVMSIAMGTSTVHADEDTKNVAAENASDNDYASRLLIRFMTRTAGISSNFKQIVRDEDGRELEAAVGEFKMARDGRFFWDYQLPYQQQLISNGVKIWIYDADLAQVGVYTAKEVVEGTVAEVLMNTTSLDDNFEVVDMGPQGKTHWLRLLPKKKSDYKTITLGFRGGDMTYMRLVNQAGQNTVISFFDIKHHDDIKAEDYVFVAPKGVEVVIHDVPK